MSREDHLELGGWIPRKPAPSDISHFCTLAEYSREYILEVLEYTNWRISGVNGAAKILGLKPTTLEARMKKLNIKRSISA